MVAREAGRDKVILPIWHNVSADDIVKYSPTLADKLAVSTSRGLPHVAERIFELVHREIGKDKTSTVNLAQSETEILEHLRRQSLVAKSLWELRQTLYELEEYLAKYPHSPDARLLKDRIQAAMRRADAMERPLPEAFRPIGRLWPILAAAAIGFLAYPLLRQLF